MDRQAGRQIDTHRPVVHADHAVGEPDNLNLSVTVGGGEVVECNHIVREGEEDLVHIGQHHHVRDPRQPGIATLQLQREERHTLQGNTSYSEIQLKHTGGVDYS